MGGAFASYEEFEELIDKFNDGEDDGTIKAGMGMKGDSDSENDVSGALMNKNGGSFKRKQNFKDKKDKRQRK